MASAEDDRDLALAKLCGLCSSVFEGSWVERSRGVDSPVTDSPASTALEIESDPSSYSDSDDSAFISCPTWGKIQGGNFTVQVHHAPAALRASATAGCQLCSMIYDQLSGIVRTLDTQTYRRLERSLGAVELQPRPNPNANDADAYETRSHLMLDVSYYEEQRFDDPSAFVPATCTIDLWPVESNSDPNFRVPASGVEPPEQIVNSIRHWVHSCSCEHPECQATANLTPSHERSGHLPTRLLDVGQSTSPNLRLCDSANVTGQPSYVTLSHCWGEILPFRLTERNHKQCLIAVPEEQLPLTFRHAVAFARRIGIRFLWIDALCIVQDSPEDWARESLQMADIYSGTYLNMAATASLDGHGGLFRERNLALISPCLVQGTWEGQTPVRYGCFDDLAFGRRVVDSTLNQRAWVFQERTLAPRTVHFAYDQIWWHCQNRVSCETFPQGAPNFNYMVTKSPAEHLQDIKKATPTEAILVWLRLVGSYAGSKITYDSDRLIALAGIASRMQEILHWNPTDYAAGIWKHGLPVDLLWSAQEIRTRKQSSYVAPSWSWASVNGEIQFKTGKIRAEYTRGVCAAVLDCETTFDHSPYGPLLSGSLTIRAEMHFITLSEAETDPHHPTHFETLTLANGVQLSGIAKDFVEYLDDNAYYDNPGEGGCVHAFWCILAQAPGILEGYIDVEGLLLRPVRSSPHGDNGTETYSRIGTMLVSDSSQHPIFSQTGGDLLKGGERKIITIM